MFLNKIYNKVARHTVGEILSKAVFTCKSGTQLCNTINFICYKKRKKKKTSIIFSYSVFAHQFFHLFLADME